MASETLRQRIERVSREARTYNLPGWGDGSAFRCHPCWVRRGQLVLVNEWHTSGSCHVLVVSDPDARVYAGCNDSFSRGSPWPKSDKGTLTRVWAGGWLIEGPWQAALEPLLDTLDAEINAAKERIAEETRIAAEMAARDRKERDDALRSSFVTT